MPGATKSVLESLTSDNPFTNVPNHHGDNKPAARIKNTTNVTFQQPKYIRQWDEFEFGALQTMYDGSLWKALGHETNKFIDRSTIPYLPFCEIHDEDSLEALLIKWNQSVVSDALEMTQSFLGATQDQDRIFMVRGGQSQRIPGIYPDWAGTQRTNNWRCRPSNILPGDTKVSWKWKSQNIQPGDTEDIFLADDWLEPINQIYTYCCMTKARYGYIITDEELVVTRIRPVSPDDSRSPVNSQDSVPSFPTPKRRKLFTKDAAADVMRQGTLEYKAIPWSSNLSDSSLTINLALWWLHMMAQESHEICHSYPPLAKAIRGQTSGAQDLGARHSRLTRKDTHAGTKRSRDEMSDEDDGSYGYLSTRRTSRRSG